MSSDDVAPRIEIQAEPAVVLKGDLQWIDVSGAGDEGVMKTQLKPANDPSSALPKPTHCTVSITYVGRLASTGVEFDRSRTPFKFDLGRGRVIRGWELVVPTMRVGERIRLRCSSRYAYGAAGSGTVIPPNADLEFDMELVSIVARNPDAQEIAAELERERVAKIRTEREEAQRLKEEKIAEKEKLRQAQPDRVAILKAKLAAKHNKKGGKKRK